MRIASMLLTLSVGTAPLIAQESKAPSAPRPRPAGWQVRTDAGGHDHGGAGSTVRFENMPPGFHIYESPSAIYWDPSKVARGSFRVESEMYQFPGRPREAYGVILGGKNLDTDGQDYLYFLVRGDGQYIIKHRAGAETHTIVNWTPSSAVVPVRSEGTAKNVLAVDVGGGRMRFSVNGTQVQDLEIPSYANLDGIVGVRVNHNLSVHVTRVDVTQR